MSPRGLPDPAAFDANARAALHDEALRKALRRATSTFTGRRAEAIGQVEDWEGLRARARAIKDHVLENLDHYVERFAERAAAAGARVHWAADAAAANALVVELAARAGARTVVKSKSMTTEEIGLNDALEAAGFEAIETDLGEWIVQLAGEAPSHIIVPAIHKSRREIGALLAERLGVKWTEDPERMTKIARSVLRRRFTVAGLGVTGVNFGVAETGTILVLENEGNARFTTTLPRVHVAVMGIEKLVPRLADLAVFLRLLPRSGTGQHLTSYQSLITGPAREGCEGPRELHVILLDNGRSRMLETEVERQALACIRCGACLNACPVYREIGGHAYGSVYPGPIGAVITPQLWPLERTSRLPFASSLCGACREVCPVAIDIPALLLHLRARVRERSRGPRVERWAFRLWAWALGGPRRYALASRLARLARPLLRGWPRAWTAHRELRPLAPRPFHRLWEEL